MFFIKKIQKYFWCFSLFFALSVFSQSGNKFKVVLDAGHGGKDFGTNHYGYVEKTVALNVALKLGKILEKNNDIQVIYTRKTDVFIELDQRAQIANKANANVFVSIHCNGVDKNKEQAYGTETFVMGTTKNASQLEVAKKENSVITLEKDYKLKYEGFDPNSPETMIGLKILQEEYINQSITLAIKIQDQYTNKLERKNRGVKQAPFWVLHRTSMPSVLTELGFLSNKPEGEYLNSEEGQNQMAKALANAILSYKKEFYGGTIMPEEIEPAPKKKDTTPVASKVKDDVKPTEVKPVESNPVSTAPNTEGIVFKVQISASGTKLETTPNNFKGLSPISRVQEGSLYKYFYADVKEYTLAKQKLQEAKDKGFNSAFLIAFKNGNRITIQEALKQ
jgi:N-acetylmuramoyl-L-alanine amidase